MRVQPICIYAFNIDIIHLFTYAYNVLCHASYIYCARPTYYSIETLHEHGNSGTKLRNKHTHKYNLCLQIYWTAELAVRYFGAIGLQTIVRAPRCRRPPHKQASWLREYTHSMVAHEKWLTTRHRWEEKDEECKTSQAIHPTNIRLRTTKIELSSTLSLL